MSSRGMGLGGGGGMTARVGVRGGTTGLRFDKKSQLQGSEESSWSCEVSLVAAAGPLGLEHIHPGREATPRGPRPKTVFGFQFSVKKICNINKLIRWFVYFESKNGLRPCSAATDAAIDFSA